MVPAFLRRLAPIALLALCAAGGFAAETPATASASAAAATPTANPLPAATAGADDVDRLVKTFNPDLLGGLTMESAFTGPASDIAAEVNGYNWFTNLIFLPFLVLPQVLLLVTMIKFHDRGDGRKPATFMHHTKLENAWTAIPILTLFIVGIPAYPLLFKMELPAKDPTHVITVRGKSFAWDYEYKREGLSFGQDIAGLQEPIVLTVNKIASLSITSNDVNHAWWVPAFGVKKDAINGRYNHVWFTPKRTGIFKGQCAELCGQGHGIMVISAVVVDEKDYATWVSLQKHRNDTLKVFKALQPDAGEYQEAAFTQQVKDYLGKGHDAARVFALRYWIASDLESIIHRGSDSPADHAKYVEFRDQTSKQRRKDAERIIAGSLAAIDTADHPVVAAQE